MKTVTEQTVYRKCGILKWLLWHLTFFRCKKYAHMKYILNRIWCLTISRRPGFLIQLTPRIVTKRCGQNNKAPRKVQLVPAMTLYSQVQRGTSHSRIFHRPCYFFASAFEAGGGWGGVGWGMECRYGHVGRGKGVVWILARCFFVCLWLIQTVLYRTRWSMPTRKRVLPEF